MPRAAWGSLRPLLGRWCGGRRNRNNYQRRWFRLRSEDRDFRLWRAAQARAQRRDPKKAKRSLAASRKWRRNNRRKSRAASRNYYEQFRVVRCHFCGTRIGCGPGKYHRGHRWCGRC